MKYLDLFPALKTFRRPFSAGISFSRFLLGVCTFFFCSGHTIHHPLVSQTLIVQDEEAGELSKSDEACQIWYDSANDVLHVDVPEEVDVVNVEIMDLDGNTVAAISSSVIPSQISLDLESGEYYVKSGSCKIIKCFLGDAMILGIA